MDEYVYKPLLAGEIRLLRLDPEGPNQLLTGSIIHIPLTNPIYHLEENGVSAHLEHHVTYEAISYHWGRETIKPFQLVIEDTAVIWLSPELHAILQRVVDPDKERLVWVDAICINQVDDNSKEKEGQIRLMPDIYRIAARVQVHLGREADNSKLAIEFINLIAEHVEYFADPTELLGAKEYQLSRAKELGPELPPEDDERWVALRLFWRRPWFRRIWVIQECVYATDIVVICGDTEIEWLNLHTAAIAYRQNLLLIFCGLSQKDITAQLPVFRDAHAGVIAFHTISELRMQAWGYKTPHGILHRLSNLENAPVIMLMKNNVRTAKIPFRQDLEAVRYFMEQSKSAIFRHRGWGQTFPFGRSDLLMLLVDTNQCLFTNPKDRMYALLGLADDVDHPEFAIWYSDNESVEAICQRFATKMISNGRCGEVLSWAGYISQTSTNRKDMPSWVPDWTSPTTNLWDLRDTMCFLMAKRRINAHNFFETMINDHRSQDVQAAVKQNMAELMTAVKEIEKHGIVFDEEYAKEGAKAWNEFEPNKRIYQAALESKVECQFHDKPATLLLKGFRVDSVIMDLAGVLDLAPFIYESFVATIITKYPTGEALQEVLWRTLIANRTTEATRAPEEYGRQYELLKEQRMDCACDYVINHPITRTCIWIFKLVILAVRALLWMAMVRPWFRGHYWTLFIIAFLESRFMMLVLIAALVATLRFLSLFVLAIVVKYPTLIGRLYQWLKVLSLKDSTFTDPWPKGLAGFSQSLASVRGAYNLCITSMGYIGLLPLATKIGDQVAIFHGCDAPFVIRRSKPDRFYTLIGECYVHGMMEGELFEDPRFPVEVIAIR